MEIVFYPTSPIWGVLKQVSLSAISSCNIIHSKTSPSWMWLQILPLAKSDPNAKLEIKAVKMRLLPL
jgi:hypothetical protein